ncbi:hypothetical protein [Sedimentisphaera salicampi]|uniref:DUF4435 domain-containing protein n=1 Tax=Sedimentisphaera salicampi TaxID=1941349 RepID=A0A1W6LMY0_9BACT|nr:hypothetical protein [Sedimentisphaera salicampi]ARN57135.1 hypothetical protein STSP1_01530 [Sedimentisphaera salicampi]
MVRARTISNSEEVKQKEQYVLFVEGNEYSIDVKVLRDLLGNIINIEPLGPSNSLKAVAKSLHKYHPYYFFLIDKDFHHKDEFVEKCWKNFPKKDAHNMLIWKKRQIENYFLIPEYLFESKYLNGNKSELENKIKDEAQKRIYLEIANSVLVDIREQIKEKWIEIFNDPSEFVNKDFAVEKLLSLEELKGKSKKVSDLVSEKSIKEKFETSFIEMTGGKLELQFGEGSWLDMIDGKKTLNAIVHSNLFSVKDTKGNTVEGKQKLNDIAKELLSKPDDVLPEDFIKLRELIKKSIRKTYSFNP